MGLSQSVMISMIFVQTSICVMLLAVQKVKGGPMKEHYEAIFIGCFKGSMLQAILI